MKKLIIISVLIVLSSGVSAMDNNQQPAKALLRLEVASTWLIQNAIKEYYSESYERQRFYNMLIDTFFVQLYTREMIIDDDKMFADIRIKNYGIYYEIQCLHRVSGSKIYEYWVLKISGHDWSKVEKDCYFIITSADTQKGVRHILKKSDVFIEDYQVNGKSVIKFPQSDLHALYWLMAWEFPTKYPNSDLKEYRIMINNQKEYEKVKISYLQKIVDIFK